MGGVQKIVLQSSSDGSHDLGFDVLQYFLGLAERKVDSSVILSFLDLKAKEVMMQNGAEDLVH